MLGGYQSELEAWMLVAVEPPAWQLVLETSPLLSGHSLLICKLRHWTPWSPGAPFQLWGCIRSSHPLSPKQAAPPQVWDSPMEHQKTTLISASKVPGDKDQKATVLLDPEASLHNRLRTLDSRASLSTTAAQWREQGEEASSPPLFHSVTSFYIVSQKSSLLPAALCLVGLSSKTFPMI